MTTFRISTVIGVWGKKLGKEEVSVDLTEWEMHSLLKAVAYYNSTLLKKLNKELIDEAKKEGYEITFVTPKPRHGGEET